MTRHSMIYETDPYLAPYKEAIEARHARIEAERDKIAVDGSLSKGLNNHLFMACTVRPTVTGFSANGRRMPAAYI